MIRQLTSILMARNPRSLLCASTISQFGDWFYATAISAAVLRAGDLKALAFITTVRYACLVFAQPLAGSLVERLPKRSARPSCQAWSKPCARWAMSRPKI